LNSRFGSALVAAIVAVCACGGTSAGSSTTHTTYQFGFTTDLSGPYAIYGKLQTAALSTYIDYLNAHGGAGGNTIKVTIKDDHADTQTALANYQEFVQSGALAMFGPLASAADAAMPPVALREGVLWVENSGTPNMFEKTQPKYEFAVTNTVPAVGTIEAKFFQDLAKKQSLASPKFAVIGYQTTGEPPYANAVIDTEQKAGWKLTDNLTVQNSTTDFSATADRMAGNKPDFIFGFLLTPQIPNFIKALRSRGITAPVVLSDQGTGGEALTKQVADANLYQYRSFAQVTDSPVVPKLQTMIERSQAAGVAPAVYNYGDRYTEWYVFGQLIQKAVEKCSANGKKCDKDSFRIALESTQVTDSGVIPEFGYTPQMHWAEHAGELVHYDAASGGSKPASGYLKL
jgi:branched-chain amino acid transport system substrate-binding protein